MTRFRCRGVLLDLDGTLVDSAAAIERHWRLWAAGHGLDAEAVLRVCQGRPTAEVIAGVAPHLDARREAREHERGQARDTDGVVALPGARRAVEALARSPWAVVTSGGIEVASSRLAAAGLPAPPVLITSGDVSRGKPDPEGYALAARRLGVPAGDCLVVEDAPAGVRAGRAAGMKVVALTTSHAAAELAEADAIAPDLSALTLAASDGGWIAIRRTAARARH